MRKTGIMIAVLLAVLAGCSATVVVMATGIITKGTNDSGDDLYMYSRDKSVRDYLMVNLYKKEVEISENITGTVVVTGENTKSYYLETINNNFRLQVSVGDYVKKGEVLFTDNNGKNIVADNNLQVTNIEKGSSFYMEVFQYINSAIAVSIPEKYQNRINTIEFFALTDESEDIPLELIKIETNVSDGNISLLLNNSFDLLEASPVDIKVKYDVLEDKISIPKEFVFFNEENKAYVHIIEEDRDNIYDQFVDVIAETDEEYIVDDDMDGYTVGYTLEERLLTD